MSGSFDVDRFAALFHDFLERVVHAAGARTPTFADRLSDHLGIDARTLPISTVAFAPFEHPDVQIAIESYLAEASRQHELIGVGGSGRFHGSTADLLTHVTVPPGPVVYTEYPVDVDARLACLDGGAVLVRGEDEPPHALIVRTVEPGPLPSLTVDVLSPREGHGSQVLDDLRTRMSRDSVYRGKVFTLSSGGHPYERDVGARFLQRGTLDRDAIVLPDGILERIERRSLGFDRHAERLSAAGQHRKHGLLLYRPPGNGKTLTVRYLIGRQPERTVVVLTGFALGAIAAAAALARRLEPAMLVLEDVDLVAQDRSLGRTGQPLLFELLNELDGIGEDADIMVILTTNRVDLLEPALAARPGRVDLAIELPLPGLEERRRLLELYTRDVAVSIEDWTPIASRIEGTPASFVRELVRSAALAAAEAGSDRVEPAHLDAALTELLESGPVNAAILGSRAPNDAPRRTRPPA